MRNDLEEDNNFLISFYLFLEEFTDKIKSHIMNIKLEIRDMALHKSPLSRLLY